MFITLISIAYLMIGVLYTRWLIGKCIKEVEDKVYYDMYGMSAIARAWFSTVFLFPLFFINTGITHILAFGAFLSNKLIPMEIRVKVIFWLVGYKENKNESERNS